MTRIEYTKRKRYFASFIKAGACFINTKTGKRISIKKVDIDPQHIAKQWKVELCAYVNKRSMPFNMEIERVAELIDSQELKFIS
jgi:hypothetical protein